MARASAVCHGKAEVEEYRVWCDRQADPLRSVILHLQIPNTLKPGLVWCAILFMLEKREGPWSRDLVEKRQGGLGGVPGSIRRFNNVN